MDRQASSSGSGGTGGARPRPRPRARPKPKPKPKPKIKLEGPEGSNKANVKNRQKGKGKGKAMTKQKFSPIRKVKFEQRSVSPISLTNSETKSVSDSSQITATKKERTPEAPLPLQDEDMKEEVQKQTKDWKAVEELWDLESDPMDPVTIPFVAEEYKRTNDNLSSLFGNIESGMASLEFNSSQARRLVTIQLPKDLPLSASPSTLGEKKNDNKLKKGPQNPFRQVKSGKIGKIKLHKSGKVKMHLGDTVFDLDAGLNCGFQEEAVAFDFEAKKLIRISGVNGRVVCTPNINSLLNRHKSEDKSKAENNDLQVTGSGGVHV